MGIRSIIIISLAVLGFSAAEYCSTSSIGSAAGIPVTLQPQHVNMPNYILQIPAVETCLPYSGQPIGVVVTACTTNPPPPQVVLLSLTQARVNANADSTVSVIVYCSNSNSQHVVGNSGQPRPYGNAPHQVNGLMNLGIAPA